VTERFSGPGKKCFSGRLRYLVAERFSGPGKTCFNVFPDKKKQKSKTIKNMAERFFRAWICFFQAWLFVFQPWKNVFPGLDR